MKVTGTSFYLLFSEEVPEGVDTGSGDFFAVVVDREEKAKEEMMEILEKGVSLDVVEIFEIDLGGEEGWTASRVIG